MNSQRLELWELAAWGFDHPVDRGLLGEEMLRKAASHAQRRLASRLPYVDNSPINVEETQKLANALETRMGAVAMSGEFDGLAWELVIVDLRKLIAFQRRIGFPHLDRRLDCCEEGSQHLLDLALPLYAPCKSPFMEVASYRGRWFLRDGYHRSSRLLNQGVCLVPCVLVNAESIAEMGAVGNRFFSEEVLFSVYPPMVTDFLDEEMTVRYGRPLSDQIIASTAQQLQEPVAAG